MATSLVTGRFNLYRYPDPGVRTTIKRAIKRGHPRGLYLHADHLTIHMVPGTSQTTISRLNELQVVSKKR